MVEEMKTFRVECTECGETFLVRFALAESKGGKEEEVAVKCTHCRKQVMVTVPAIYLPRGDDLVRLVGR